MSNSYFQFKQFRISQEHSSMKVTTDACLFGAWIASKLKNKNAEHVLDIGAGTGLLSLMVAQENRCMIDAVEIEEAAAKEARLNIEGSPWKNDIQIMQGDINSIVLKKYDAIISNPPFYEGDLKGPSGKKNIAHHSEELSLEQLVMIISQHLTGRSYLLLPYRRKNEIIAMVKSAGMTILEIVNVSHSAKHQPTRIMIAGEINLNDHWAFVEKQFYIKEPGGEYSDEFKRLLQPFYLAF